MLKWNVGLEEREIEIAVVNKENKQLQKGKAPCVKSGRSSSSIYNYDNNNNNNNRATAFQKPARSTFSCNVYDCLLI
jgi:hypothetical protein